jgi:hypothetical protein
VKKNEGPARPGTSCPLFEKTRFFVHSGSYKQDKDGKDFKDVNSIFLRKCIFLLHVFKIKFLTCGN